MIQAFNQFKKNYTNETAEQKVRELVASGRMSQRQLNQLQGMATNFQKMLNSMK